MIFARLSGKFGTLVLDGGTWRAEGRVDPTFLDAVRTLFPVRVTPSDPQPWKQPALDAAELIGGKVTFLADPLPSDANLIH